MYQMLLCKWKAMAGALALGTLAAVRGPICVQAQIPAPIQAPAQTPIQTPIQITVEDEGGQALAGATVTDAAGKVLGRTDASGHASVACTAPCPVQVAAKGFAAQSVTLTQAATIRLQPAGVAEQVTVTAYRTPVSELESPATTRVLEARALRTTAAITLDDQLRQLPGVELFRRSPSLVANPTSQGISLRGLGSTSASRTLVMEDEAPLNDPLGGWIHWQEEPELAIHSIELVRGG